MVSTAGFNCRGPSSFPGRAEHKSVNSSDIVNFLLKSNDREVAGLIRLYGVLAMLNLKSRRVRRVSHQTAYMGNCY